MVVEQLNFTLFENTNGERFITFFIGHYDYRLEKLTYVNAGHNPPVLCRKGSDQVEVLEAGTTILGAFEHLPFLDQGERTQLRDFSLHLYTDGLTETINPQEEEFGEDRFLQFIEGNMGVSPGVFHEKFFLELEVFSEGMPKRDDITLLSIKFN